MDVIKVNLQNINKESLIQKLKAVVADGNLLVYPTDTLYGLGTDPYNSKSIEKINNLKGRPTHQKISIAIPDLATLNRLCEIDSGQLCICEKLLPGPVTLIVRAGGSAPKPVVTSENTIGIRMPNQPLVLTLLGHTGPLTVTSANRHGGPEPENIEIAKSQLGDSIALYLDYGPCKFKIPSTILDLTSEVPKILREGVISRNELEKQLGIKVG